MHTQRIDITITSSGEEVNVAESDIHNLVSQLVAEQQTDDMTDLTIEVTQPEGVAGDPYVIVEGGLVQNTPALPVFDFDVLKTDLRDDLSAQEVAELKERVINLADELPHNDPHRQSLRERARSCTTWTIDHLQTRFRQGADITYMPNAGDPDVRQWLFDRLDEHGVLEVNVEFDGGGDEGDVRTVTFVHHDGSETTPSLTPPRDVQDATTAGPEFLACLTTEPVWQRYGSFAGDFWAEGTVTWDVRERTVQLTGTERPESGIELCEEV